VSMKFYFKWTKKSFLPNWIQLSNHILFKLYQFSKSSFGMLESLGTLVSTGLLQ
jgi:hypothetical protein